MNEKNPTSKEKYTYSQDWKNRCLVRDKMKKMTDDQIGTWLRELEKEKSTEHLNEIRDLLREEYYFVKAASKLRNF